MPVDVLTETLVGRPLAEVADYAIDPGNAPEWYANIVRVEWETPAPLAVGSRLAFEARFLGRRLAYTYEIVELEPGSGWSCAPHRGRFRWRRPTPSRASARTRRG